MNTSNATTSVIRSGTLDRFPAYISESLLTSTDSMNIDNLSFQPESPTSRNDRKVIIPNFNHLSQNEVEAY